MAKNRPVQVIAITGGKGGVGKTNVAVNLAMCLSANAKKVMLFDADLGLANVDVLLGIYPKRNLMDVINGTCSLDDIILDGPGGIKIVPASSGVKNMAQLSPTQHAGLIRAFSELKMDIDVLIVDTAAGISDSVVSFCQASQEVVMVICDEPASMTDAYGLIKLLNQDHGLHRFRILTNMANSAQQARSVYDKIVKVTDRFLDVTLDYIGYIPYDENVVKAIRKQRAVVEAYPRSKAGLAFKTLADKVVKWPVPKTASGHLEFFVERFVQGNIKSKNMEALP